MCYTDFKNSYKYGSNIQIIDSRSQDQKVFHMDLHEFLKYILMYFKKIKSDWFSQNKSFQSNLIFLVSGY